MTITYAPDKPYRPPLEDELISKALEFMKECYPKKKYRELVKSKELYPLAKLKAGACKDYAENLIKMGEFPNQAWNWAIRQEILETEPD